MSERGTRVYTVHGYYLTQKTMKVRAETEGEAIEKAKAGEYFDVDTEPGPDVHTPKWTAKKLEPTS
jgi:hypothetical protein